jgi:very-short-patch-repair endonuclease
MPQPLAPGATQVLDLLHYIEQVEKLKKKPAFSVPSEYFVVHLHEMKSLPELQLNLQSDGDDVWLRLPRLQEIAPPEPGETLKPWVVLSKTPEKAPELRAAASSQDGAPASGTPAKNDLASVQEFFDWYVAFLWKPWAAAEAPRRKAIAAYNKLFALQQAIASEGAETALELVWGIGFASWKKPGFATPLRHPLLVQACEVTLNEANFDLEVRPRDVEPRLEADCFSEMELAGVKQLEASWKSALATGANRVNPFDATSYEEVLKAAVGYLDPAGAYLARPGEALSQPGEHLLLTNTWVLFGRKRSSDVFIEDIERLKKQVESAASLPGVIRCFVEPGDDTVRKHPEQLFRGLSSSDAGPQAMELYFPMPYNDEQVSIVQKLHANDGVVVQGPPGTGKTHTIANVICHYLASGKRVLVTAKSETALAVLQEKLPERIRPLSVALLSDERDGMKQFEHSIQTIAAGVEALIPSRVTLAISAGEARLNELHVKIARVDQTVAEYATKHMRSYGYQGREMTPGELAKAVLEQAEPHGWFDDEPGPSGDSKLPFDEKAIQELRQARMKVGQDIARMGETWPRREAFPDRDEVLRLHRHRLAEGLFRAGIREGRVWALRGTSEHPFEKAQVLLDLLEQRATLKAKLASVKKPWHAAFAERIADMQADDPALAALVELCAEVCRRELQRRTLLGKAVAVPPDAELNADVMAALVRLASGKSAFSLPFGKGDARRCVAAISVGGAPPAGEAEWNLVKELMTWRTLARKTVARWAPLAHEFGLDTVESGVEPALRQLDAWRVDIEDLRRMRFDFDARIPALIAEVFPHTVVEQYSSGSNEFLAKASVSLGAHLEQKRLGQLERRVQDLIRLADGSGHIVEQIRFFLTHSLGAIDVDEDKLLAKWDELMKELTRLSAVEKHLETIAGITRCIESAGAPKWAQRLRTVPASADVDTMTPASWFEAWNWRLAVSFLDRIDGHRRIRELFEQRRQLTTLLARTYQELIADKTWLGIFNNSPQSVRQALQVYLNAVQDMGSGRGLRAVRYRRNAREAMRSAYRAVPCWVLPQWRVSETIPPEVGLFDLVVIDEASQSDIWALPALLRGRKVLVVGDDKQVSPSAVGTAEEKILELIHRFLGRQPHGSQMTPEKSIYDLARVVFAGNSVMLKEHFRCVPAIIEFSNREFYQGAIRPLRVPKANERLDPPLVDVFVKGGYRDGDVNRPEAKAIVDEIETILVDPQLAGRSIGVVTLLGTAQAALIHQMVHERIVPADIVARKIAVGPPPVFQGRERDIMMVSMVLGVQDRGAANRIDMHQRFNVALSRARDRMYLFRSVPETHFKEDSLNGRLLNHFKRPFHQDARKVEALRERCESGFEREMFDELIQRGFRVEPQVPCGGFRIDFVVEGREGRRLAVECDGDRFHGPGQWKEDMARQRVLERAGWTFWRCFASSFMRRREEMIADLMQTLQNQGIEPLGAESVDNTAWVLYKEVEPYTVDAAVNVAVNTIVDTVADTAASATDKKEAA